VAILAGIAVVLALYAAPISAAPPRTATITSTGTTERHPTATWTLPPGVDPQVIEIASAPSVGSDGHFLEEYREVSDRLQKGQTSYVDFEELGLGTYWVHIQTVDNNCSSSEESACTAWSNIARLTIAIRANVRPALRLVHFNAGTREAQVTACDETNGRLTFRTTLSRGHTSRRRTYSPSTKPTYTEGERNCSLYYVPLPALYGTGRYTMTMTVTDARGGKSKPVVKRFSVGD
jgi:hypothetical protein